jgi:hypothetical protein
MINASFQSDLNTSQAPLYNVNLPGQNPEHIPLKAEAINYMSPYGMPANGGMLNPGLPQGHQPMMYMQPQQQQHQQNQQQPYGGIQAQMYPSQVIQHPGMMPQGMQLNSGGYGYGPQYNMIPQGGEGNFGNIGMGNIPMQQPMMMGQQPMMMGQQYNLPQAVPIKKGYEKLMVPGVYVKQKLEMMEIFTGCETENKYHVYACDVDGQKAGQYIFKCSEKSECLQRNLLSGDCRKFEMQVKHESDGKFSNDGSPFIFIKRPFKCTIACLQRPYVEVEMLEEGAKKFVGKIVHDFSCCCDVVMSLYDNQDRVRYRIKGSLCQIGFYAARSCFCRNCQQAFFFIENEEGDSVAVIEKRGKGFKELISDADNYSVRIFFYIYI